LALPKPGKRGDIMEFLAAAEPTELLLLTLIDLLTAAELALTGLLRS
jgi:hypothetical protein